MPDVGSTVHVSITQVPDAIEDLAGGERVVLVGGVDAESAVACGLSPAVRDDGTSVGVLTAQHDSGHAGAIIIRPVEGGTLIEVVIVSPASPGVEPSGSPGTVTPGSPAPSGAGLSPVRSPLPGTSGAPPFSPIPGAASEP